MAEKDGSTMTAEERLARAWQLFEEVQDREARIDAPIRAIRASLDESHVESAMAFHLAGVAEQISSELGLIYSLGDMLRPEGVAA